MFGVIFICWIWMLFHCECWNEWFVILVLYSDGSGIQCTFQTYLHHPNVHNDGDEEDENEIWRTLVRITLESYLSLLL
jgi:hypothetical protein